MNVETIERLDAFVRQVCLFAEDVAIQNPEMKPAQKLLCAQCDALHLALEDEEAS